jgi:type I restriction enzyme M protein
MNITSIIKSIRDIMRKDVGVDGDAQRISQMVWMLFLKIFSDKEEEWELTIENYESPIPEKFKWDNWAADEEGLTGDELMEFIDNELFPVLKEIDTTISDQAKIVKAVFEDTYNYMKNGTLFRQVINEIGKIDFNSSKESHVFNDLYETILKELQSAGSSGEYYTPRGVTQFIVDMVNPQLGETVLDPACGTGGFLTCAIDHIRQQVNTPKATQTLQKSIRGVEKKPLPHLLCTTNLILHKFDVPALTRGNMLAKPYGDWTTRDRVNVVLSNPPFGGTEEDGTETNFPAKFRTKETADLFLALIVKILRVNGRAGVVLPDGSLFGEGVKTRIKEDLMAKCNLHTIIRLPNGVFSPYTNIKTNLLFFDKGTPTKEIWYYELPYPDGIKNFNKTRPINIKDFDVLKTWWKNRVENEYAWKVSAEEIKAKNYNLDSKNPYEAAQNFIAPEELLKQYQAIEKNIKTIQKNIVKTLSEVL